MSKIVAVHHDETGSISEYKLDDGRVIDRDTAVKETNEGKIEGVASFTTRNGEMAIRSNAGQVGYSLDELPEIDQIS